MKKLLHLSLAGILLAAILLPACSHRAETAPWLAEALTAHRQADAQIERGELDAARASLVHMVERSAPSGLAEADRQAIRQDGFFRLVDLELDAGQPAAALAWADTGLKLGDGADLFAANLHLGRGKALEALGRDAEAVEAYGRAMAINERLLHQTLSDEEGPAASERSRG